MIILKKFSFTPKGVCSSKMNIVIDNGIIKDIEIVGGCPGNTLGVSKLCVDRKVEDVIELLSGIDCRGRGTSCPDQLAKALEEILVEN